jgi:hypothetical protein
MLNPPMRQLMLVFVCTSFAALAPAQTGEFEQNHAAVGVEPPIRVGKADHFSTPSPLSAEFGYSFTRVLRSDVGAEIALGGAESQNAVQTRSGPVQSGSQDRMILFGGRYMLPSPLTRIDFSAGGGGHSETPSSTGYFSSACYTRLSRRGWGSCGPGNAGSFFGHSQNFHLGTAFEFIVAPSTAGQTGYVPAARGTDGWSNLYLEIGFRF